MRGLKEATISSLFLLPLVLATRYNVIYEEDDQLATPTGLPDLLGEGSYPLPPLVRVIEKTIYTPNHLVGRAGCDYCNASSATPACCVSGAGVQYCCSDVAICTTAGWCCPWGGQACPNGAIGACITEGQTCCGRGVCDAGQTCCGRGCCPSDRVCRDGVCLNPGTSSTSTNSSTTTSTTTTRTTSTSSSVSLDTDSSTSTPLPQDTSTSNDTSTITSSSTDDSSIDPSTTPLETSTPSNDPSTNSVEASPSETMPTATNDPSTTPLDTPAPSPDPPTNSVEAVPSDTIVDSSSAVQSNPPISSDTGSSSTDAPASSSVPASDPPQIVPFVATADVDLPSTTPDAPIDSPVVTQETIVTSGTTLTTSRTVQPFVISASSSNVVAANNAFVPGSDAVAYVYPWDPRIQYDPEDAWISTSSSSSVGNCHNGTKVSSTPDSSIKFGFEGKQIALLICNGSKGGNYTVQVDGSPASTYNSWKDPTISGSDASECIISQPFTSTVLDDGPHNITVIVKGSRAGTTTQQGQVEFGGFIYHGPRAFGTRTESKPNLPAIIGGAVGGVIGGIAIITVVVVLVILRKRRRNQRVDSSPAVDNAPPPPPTFTSAPTYSAVPTTEYHDPYANAGYGPQYYPNPSASTSTPSWRQTDTGPFGSGSYAAQRM